MTRVVLAAASRIPFALIVGGASGARATAPVDRVVVVVDGSAGLGVDGDAVRRAISEELRAPVIAPSDQAAGDAPAILVVSVDRAAIRMTLRANGRGATTRAIPAASDRSVRLRDIRWLAGNLLRDQVSPIVGLATPGRSTSTSAPAPATAPRPLVAEATPPQEPIAPPRPTAGPSGAPVAPSFDAVAARASTAPGAPRPQWALAALAGMAVAPNYESWWASTYQLDAHHRAPYGLVLGLGLQAGYAFTGGTVHMFGGAGVLGKEWRGSTWFGELTAGLGFEAIRPITVGGANTCTACVIPPRRVSGSPVFALFLPLAFSVGAAVTSGVDVVARLNVEPSAYGLFNTTGGATAGVRFRVR
jgi:hypothetical protein